MKVDAHAASAVVFAEAAALGLMNFALGSSLEPMGRRVKIDDLSFLSDLVGHQIRMSSGSECTRQRSLSLF